MPESVWRRLVRYVSGESDPGEAETLQVWIVEERKRARLMDELRCVWEATEAPALDRDVEMAWQAVSEKMDAPPVGTRNPEREGVRQRTRRPSARAQGSWRSRWRVAAVVAATAVLTVLAATLFMTPSSERPLRKSDEKVFVTRRGQRATIQLRDGTEVHLNVDSRLELPPGGFVADRRVVFLEGEAYFDVAPEAGRPFLVRTGGAVVRVLGTAFDVRAYGEEGLQVAVAEGEVALHPDSAAPQEKIVLRPGQVARAARGVLRDVRQGVDLTPYVAWTMGRLVFRDAPFGEVIRELERWFDLEIEVRAPMERIDRLNATFHDEPLSQVLQAVAAALNLQYARGGGTIIFYRRTPDVAFRLTK